MICDKVEDPPFFCNRSRTNEALHTQFSAAQKSYHNHYFAMSNENLVIIDPSCAESVFVVKEQ